MASSNSNNDIEESINKDCKTAQKICEDVVNANVCISAKVVIDPIVEIGPIRTECLPKPEVIPCDEKFVPGRDKSCSFIVRQRVCVEIPIAFGTSTTAIPFGMACKGVDVGPCKCDQ